MSELQPIIDYHFEHPTSPAGDVVEHRFILTLKRPAGEIDQKAMQDLLTLPGIDQVQPMGRYTIDMIVARTFDVDAVKESIIKQLERVQSGIITPQQELITP